MFRGNALTSTLKYPPMWSEITEPDGSVTYSNALTQERVNVNYKQWFTVVDDEGEVYWWNVATGDSAWERQGWNQTTENGVHYYFNNITRQTSLEMPANYPPEVAYRPSTVNAGAKSASGNAAAATQAAGARSAVQQQPLSSAAPTQAGSAGGSGTVAAIGAASTARTGLAPLSTAPTASTPAEATPLLQKQGTSSELKVASTPTAAAAATAAPMSKEEKAAHDALFRRYKRQFLSRSNLANIPLFAGLAPHDEVLITSLFKLQVVPNSTALCEEGELGSNLFVVCQGAIALEQSDPKIPGLLVDVQMQKVSLEFAGFEWGDVTGRVTKALCALDAVVMAMTVPPCIRRCGVDSCHLCVGVVCCGVYVGGLCYQLREFDERIVQVTVPCRGLLSRGQCP